MTDKRTRAIDAYNAADAWRQNIAEREDNGDSIPSNHWHESDDMYVEAAHLLFEAINETPIVFAADGQYDLRRGDVLTIDLDDCVDDLATAQDAVRLLIYAGADQADIDTVIALWGDEWDDGDE